MRVLRRQQEGVCLHVTCLEVCMCLCVSFVRVFFSAPAVLVLMELPALQPLMFILAALIELRTRCGHAMQ